MSITLLLKPLWLQSKFCSYTTLSSQVYQSPQYVESLASMQPWSSQNLPLHPASWERKIHHDPCCQGPSLTLAQRKGNALFTLREAKVSQLSLWNLDKCSLLQEKLDREHNSPCMEYGCIYSPSVKQSIPHQREADSWMNETPGSHLKASEYGILVLHKPISNRTTLFQLPHHSPDPPLIMCPPFKDCKIDR